ncbi:hypothetical protein [Marinobacter sp.]|uniref:hypothetical protein n=1 Tax=Marinobacter sp. TaxID=50741 RepID=UPI0035C762BF
MTLLSICLFTNHFTFLSSEGEALILSPLQVFHTPEAVDCLPNDVLTILASQLVFSATKSA